MSKEEGIIKLAEGLECRFNKKFVQLAYVENGQDEASFTMDRGEFQKIAVELNL